jgi:hypothetical protein
MCAAGYDLSWIPATANTNVVLPPIIVSLPRFSFGNIAKSRNGCTAPPPHSIIPEGYLSYGKFALASNKDVSISIHSNEYI